MSIEYCIDYDDHLYYLHSSKNIGSSFILDQKYLLYYQLWPDKTRVEQQKNIVEPNIVFTWYRINVQGLGAS